MFFLLVGVLLSSSIRQICIFIPVIRSNYAFSGKTFLKIYPSITFNVIGGLFIIVIFLWANNFDEISEEMKIRCTRSFQLN